MFRSVSLILSLAIALCSSYSKHNDVKSRTSTDVQFDDVVTLNVDQSGQCIFMISEERTYSFASPGGQQVCGLYVITEPEYVVEFEFESFQISCSNGGLLSVIDGWELNGQFFPGSFDHPKQSERRHTEFCGPKKPRKVLRSSQNVGLLEFRVPMPGDGFTVSVRFQENLKPCNAVLRAMEGFYTLRNYGRPINCSVSILFPEWFRILSLSVGVQRYMYPRQHINFDVETGSLRKCYKRGLSDYVEIKGGNGLDPGMMEVAEDFCGLDSTPNKNTISVGCGNTAVRLVSSGLYENSVTFQFGLLENFDSLNLACPARR